MAKLVRFIYRFDFSEVCSRYLNCPGTAYEILNSVEEKFWDTVSDNVQNRALSAVYKSENKVYRELNFLPFNVNGSVEFLSGGIDIDDLRKDPSFVAISKLTNDFCHKFEVHGLARAGIRLFLVESAAGDQETFLGRSKRIVRDDVIVAVNDNLGELTDIAFSLEGKGEDQIFYRVSFGPLVEEDTDKYLFPKGKPEKKDLFIESGYNFMSDMDFYEKDFSIQEFTLEKWARTKVGKASIFMTEFSKLMIS